jgi:oxygen-dependent protoporphyrinogen oxidase
MAVDTLSVPGRAGDAPHVVIVGGGITGLAAAESLERAIRAGVPVRYTLIEATPRLGGKILTERVGPFLVEGGPDSFVAQKPWAADLARALGLGPQLTEAATVRQATWVLHRGRPRPMPVGMQLIVPTQAGPFVASPLLSPLGKLRMALDLVIPPRPPGGDESLAAFIRRRFGQEALERLAEPLMGGIHSADPERQSLLATFPRFRELELRHGGLIRGMRAVQQRIAQDGGRRANAGYARFLRRPRQHGFRLPPPVVDHRPPAAGAAPFLTLRGGLGTLVAALEARIGGRTLLGRRVVSLAAATAGGPPYRLWLDDGAMLEADAVILATPAVAAADLVAPFAPSLAAEVRAIRYASTGIVTLAYRRAEIGQPLDGFGLIIPRGEGRAINAITLTSQKFPGRAPDDHLLLRVFVGGARTPEALALDDERLLALARAELRAIFGIAAAPVLSRVHRWENGNPQYDVGHLDRVARIERLAPEGLTLCGAAYGGVGIPDCVRQGQEAAARALALVGRLAAGTRPTQIA